MQITQVHKKRWWNIKSTKIRTIRAAGNYIQRMKYSEAELLMATSNMLKLHRIEVEWSRSFIGRIFNFISPYDAQTIQIDGSRLDQLLQLKGIEPPIEIHVAKQYRIDVASLKQLAAKPTAPS